ncbi:septum formation initiator family protein [Fluviibacterium sp. DFM31]|uniref:Septum formation initiator family protein n=1 Tax=Meridianimarinicoccus marinus TaxID=3231483 RepID=A0ABV3L1M2_9RHOB
MQGSGFGFLIYTTVAVMLGGYFAFAALQGDLGVLRRLEIEADQSRLEAQRDALQTRVDALKNKTHRLSDNFLDLDLLDERAREVLGLMRADDLIIR